MVDVIRRKVIQLVVDGSQVNRAARRVETSFDRISRAARAARGLLVGAFAGFLGAGLVRQLFEVNRAFDLMRGQLRTMTGSAENAAEAFEALEQFAAETPFTLDQSVTAFTKLVSLGLNPSEEALRSFGNTASAFGKDLTQFIEAVADASTGEFERLKEFGIRARKQGEEIAFTFQGVTTTVGNNSEAIQGFLQSIGDTNFAGAMQEQMAGLVGSVSNAEDAFARFLRTIGDAGFTALLVQGFRAAGDALNFLSDLISTGAGIDLLVAHFVAFNQEVDFALNLIDLMGVHFVDNFGRSAAAAEQFLQGPLTSIVTDFPANFKFAVTAITIEALALWDTLSAGVGGFVAGAGKFFGDLARTVQGVWESIKLVVFSALDAQLQAFASTLRGVGSLLANVPGLENFAQSVSGASANLNVFTGVVESSRAALRGIANEQASADAAFTAAERSRSVAAAAAAQAREESLQVAANELVANKAATEAGVAAALAKVEETRAASAGADVLAKYAREQEKSATETGKAAAATRGLSEAQKEINALQSEANRIFESTRTPLERYRQEIEKLNELRAAGVSGDIVFSEDTFIRAVRQAGETLGGSFEAAKDKAKSATDEMSQFATQAARNMQDAFADFLFDPFDEGLDGLIEGFTKTLQRMAADAASAKIFEAIGGGGSGGGLDSVLGGIFGGGGGGGGGLGGLFGGLFGGFFAEGGRFGPNAPIVVGERGPELIVPRQPGTVVPLDRPSAQGLATVNNNISINVPGGAPDKRTVNQIAAAVGTATQRAIDRNR